MNVGAFDVQNVSVPRGALRMKDPFSSLLNIESSNSTQNASFEAVGVISRPHSFASHLNWRYVGLSKVRLQDFQNLAG
jgi:hypothetical protein